MVRNISKRRSAEDALRDSEERYRDLYHNLPLAYFTADKNGNLTDMNDRGLKLTGYSWSELVGIHGELEK